MSISKHALARCRQRGIPEDLLAVIGDFGTKERRPHGAIRKTLRKRDCDRMIHELKRLIQKIEKMKRKGISIVIAEDTGTIITTYRQG